MHGAFTWGALDRLLEEPWLQIDGISGTSAGLLAATVVVLVINWRTLGAVRDSLDAGANTSVLPILSVASLVGFGAVVAAVPAFEIVRDLVLGIEGGPPVSLAVATNLLSALTGSASGGLTIALDALGTAYMRLAAEHGIDPALLHRIAVMSAGTLDSLPQNGAVVTMLRRPAPPDPRRASPAASSAMTGRAPRRGRPVVWSPNAMPQSG